jgi:hypothetical protein
MLSQPPFDRAQALSGIERALAQVVGGIDLCVKAGLHAPALILLYSGVDIAGWMASESPSTSVRDSFTAWVDKYLRPTVLGCTALELYGARCAILHTLTTESKLYEDGHVRKIIYAWFPSGVETLRRMSAMMPEYIAVQADHLVDAYRRGIALFMEDLKEAPESHLAPMALKVLHLMPTGEVASLVALAKRVGLDL